MRHTLPTVVLAMAVASGPAGADSVDRPEMRALGLDQLSLLSNFTPDVTRSAKLTGQAMALWNQQYAPRAADLERRFLTDDDWRPPFADIAVLVDDFLEASGLPRARSFPAPGGQQWVETLDPATQRRTRVLRPARRSDRVIAPGDRGKSADQPKLDDPKRRPRPAPVR